MKKIIKNPIFTFILGAIIFGSIGIVSAYTIFANDIGYTPKDTSWEVDNVKDAIDDLYNKANNLGNTNSEKRTELLSFPGTNTLTYNFNPNYIMIHCDAISGYTYDVNMYQSPNIYSHVSNGGTSGSITIDNNVVEIVLGGYARGSGVANCEIFASE